MDLYVDFYVDLCVDLYVHFYVDLCVRNQGEWTCWTKRSGLLRARQTACHLYLCSLFKHPARGLNLRTVRGQTRNRGGYLQES